MFKRISISMALIVFMSGLSFSADEFTLMREERIGGLSIGMPEQELKQKLKKEINCVLKRGPERLWGADGLYHQKWEYAGCGLVIGMVSEKRGAPKSIDSIAVVGPGGYATKRGIRIGSTKQEVMKAYKENWNKEESGEGGFTAGSIYGGLIFDFKKGRVSRIFLGAGAE